MFTASCNWLAIAARMAPTASGVATMMAMMTPPSASAHMQGLGHILGGRGQLPRPDTMMGSI